MEPFTNNSRLRPFWLPRVFLIYGKKHQTSFVGLGRLAKLLMDFGTQQKIVNQNYNAHDSP